MDKFLETHNLPRLNHEETEIQGMPKVSKEIESVIKKFQCRKAQDQMVLLVNFYKPWKN